MSQRGSTDQPGPRGERSAEGAGSSPSASRFVALMKADHPTGDKVTLVWWSTMEHQCRSLWRAVPVPTLDALGEIDGYVWIFDLFKRRRALFGEERSELEDGWTIGEGVNAWTQPSNWSPPGTSLGKLYRLPAEWS